MITISIAGMTISIDKFELGERLTLELVAAIILQLSKEGSFRSNITISRSCHNA